MADKDTEAAQDPSIEEILASIRQIISDDDAPAAPAPADETPLAPEVAEPVADTVLDLTEDMQADTTFADALNAINDTDATSDTVAVHDFDIEFQNHEETPSVDGSADAIDAFLADMKKDEGPRMPTNSAPQDASSALFDTVAASATMDAFSRLTENVALSRRPVEEGALTLEDIVKDLLRPMLRQWINENVPAIVEALVEKELEKLSRRAVAE